MCDIVPYLDYHSQSNRNKNLLGVIKRLKASEQRPRSDTTLGRHLLIRSKQFLLLLGDMQETAVGSVEQRDAEGEVQAHDPELALRCK